MDFLAALREEVGLIQTASLREKKSQRQEALRELRALRAKKKYKVNGESKLRLCVIYFSLDWGLKSKFNLR